MPCLGACLAKCQSVLTVNVPVCALNKEKALVGTLSVIVKTSRTFVSSSTRHIHSGSGSGSTPPLVKLYSPPMFIFPLPPHYG